MLALIFFATITYMCTQHCTTHEQKAITQLKNHHADQQHYPFSLPQLKYAYSALEPHIDEKTMRIHHQKHHQAYVDNLNKAIKSHKQLHTKTLFDLIKEHKTLPDKLQTAITNHGGGHFNHSLFWTTMTPLAPKNPTGKLKHAIEKTFGSFDAFKEQFSKEAKTVFGSGWAWLVLDTSGDLKIVTTSNQETPDLASMTPILCLDVWEHAYYLNYQNRRMDYITAWWHVINWPQVAHYYEQALNKQCA